MERTRHQHSPSNTKISPRNEQFSDFVYDKQIVVKKDVNGIAVTQDNILLLALGAGSRGGIGRLDIGSGQLTVHQSDRAFRQIMVDSSGNVIATTHDTIYTYAVDDLDSAKSVFKPGSSVWGVCQTPDNQLIFSDVKKKKVYKAFDQGSSMIVRKTNENKLQSTWSLVCDGERLYISDRKKRQVVCTSLDGTFLWRQKLGRPFPKYSKALEHMADDYVGGLCADGKGNILVCDTVNNRLTELTAEGAVSHYNDLELDKPAYVTANSGCVAIVNNPTLIDCTVRIYKQSTTL